jgi:hypothetical protein
MTQFLDFWSEHFVVIPSLIRAKKVLLIFAFWMLLGFLMAVGVQATAMSLSVPTGSSPPLEVVQPET